MVMVPGVRVIELATRFTTASEPPRIGTAMIAVCVPSLGVRISTASRTFDRNSCQIRTAA